ncbi:imelysin family protein [Vibrio harveyi]|uniref:imelysin family protein n=1 Tax=Vibrio harveyi TaxID=669 RepID=UPI003CF52B7C
MKKTLLVSAIAATLSLAGCQSTNGSSSVEPESTSHISQNVYEVEFNAAQAFVTQTTKLELSLTEYCASHMKSDAQIKQRWHQTMLAWMALQGQERGPATALEQSWNVQFWPDKKNTTGRKMSVLTKSDQIWSAEDISTQSVTVQGLGALEWLLYDKASSLSTNSNTCATSIAIAENLNNKANIIADSWAQNPWKSLDMTEWESEYISLLSNQLEYSMKKLSRPLAKIGKPRPYFSESWRSQTSLSNLKANLEALQALYLANGSGLDALLREQGHSELADRVVHQFDMALDTWPEDKSLFAALQTKDGYRMVLAQYNKLEQLKYLIHEEVAIELGVVIGFNATDGD